MGTTLTDCTISDNSGNGLFNQRRGNLDPLHDQRQPGPRLVRRAPVNLTDCTISGNSGGGLCSRSGFGTMTLIDCMISGNSRTQAVAYFCTVRRIFTGAR